MTATQLKASQTAAPTLTSATAQAGGGSMPASAMYYKITACGPWGESAASTEKTATPAAGGHIDLVIASPPAGTSSIRVYRGTVTNTENVLVAILGGPWTGTYSDIYAAAGGMATASPPATAAFAGATKSGAALTKANIPAGTPAGNAQLMIQAMAEYTTLCDATHGGTGPLLNLAKKNLAGAGFAVQEV